MENNKKEKYRLTKGLSLIEMIIAIGIFFIGMVAFVLLFVHGWKTNSFIMGEGENSATASRGVDLITKDLRRIRRGDEGSYLIKSANSNDLIVYVDVERDGITERVHYFLDENTKKIKRGITKPAGTNPVSYPSGDGTTTDVISYITNNSSNPIFYYYGTDYPVSSDPITTPVSSSQLQDIHLVKIVISVDINSNKEPSSITLESIVELRNINNYVY